MYFELLGYVRKEKREKMNDARSSEKGKVLYFLFLVLNSNVGTYNM